LLPIVEVKETKERFGKYASSQRKILVNMHHQKKNIWERCIVSSPRMSYEEEDTCHMRRRIHVIRCIVSSPRRSCSLSQT
jgi:hypothetical protein